MNCPECGQENAETARFCVSCGYQFRAARAGDTSELDAPAGEPVAVDDTAENDPVGDAPPPPDFGQISRPRSPAETSPLHPSADTREFSAQDFLLMVVDDTPDNLILISLHLQQAGYRVITASNGEEAVKLAAASRPDLILMDIGMPTLDGLGATRQLRENPSLKDVRVIALTAFSTDGFRRAAYDAGIDGYLTKPVDFDRLTNLIRRLLPAR
ncbi:MAG TPA: response regulator [Pyrinomonadaceae bacterium]|nr:response regulator [Pyrinomonadaceae bacterium]